MKRLIPWSSLLALTVALPAARAEVNVYLGSAPPPPAIVFSSPPSMVLVPGTRVYVVRAGDRPAYDYYRYGSTYYIYNDGYWYRSTAYNGPYRVIETRYVPRQIVTVRSHPHGMPPGQAKKYRHRGRRG